MRAEEAAEGRFEDYFRDGAVPLDALRLWQLAQRGLLVDPLRALFHGPVERVRLRVWVFVELMARPQSRIERDELNRHFHALRSEPLELVLKRLRDASLLILDTTTQLYCWGAVGCARTASAGPCDGVAATGWIQDAATQRPRPGKPGPLAEPRFAI
jgi:hypothetical protein